MVLAFLVSFLLPLVSFFEDSFFAGSFLLDPFLVDSFFVSALRLVPPFFCGEGEHVELGTCVQNSHSICAAA